MAVQFNSNVFYCKNCYETNQSLGIALRDYSKKNEAHPIFNVICLKNVLNLRKIALKIDKITVRRRLLTKKLT